ncbi:PAS domain-containing protein [Natronomonas amylolytica]|uniref:PAS domain-containing protein n=1 Tax=Natronomonas amylolytica TaxID=3108498 RepID=UPI00300B56ED
MADTLLRGASEALDEQRLIADVGEEVNVLHIEDDRSFADLVSTFLQREHDYFNVETETHPRDGLEYLKNEDVDCVVSDYEMPEVDGLDVLERVRDEYPDMPFILFTGKGSEEIASEAISKGVTEYLQKGGGTEQYEVLANRIEQAVARYRAERQVTRGFHAIETAHDGISLLDDDGQFIYVNEAYANITGYGRDELLGSHWDVLYPDDELDRAYEEMLPEARENEWKGRTVYRRKDGDLVDVDHRLTYTTDNTLICTIADVSEAEEVRAELSLKERAMNEAPVGITITDPAQEDNPIIYANDKFVELTGYFRKDIIGRNCRFLQGVETREELRAEMREAIDNADPVTVELRNYRNDGEMFWNRVSLAPILDEGGTPDYFVGFQQDVTKRRELQERHEEWIRMMQGFGQVLAHDLQTPLDVIQGRIELAQETGVVDHLEDVEETLDRVEELTEDLADVMQTGELVSDRESVDVAELAEDVWHTLDARDASLDVDSEISDVYADERALQRMLENLLGNSLEHGEEDVTVHVGGLDDKNGFYIEDDGPGIPVDERDDVFIPGFTTKEGGTGFGMASVAQLVAAHGWRIRVRDGIDGGARFEVFDTEE